MAAKQKTAIYARVNNRPRLLFSTYEDVKSGDVIISFHTSPTGGSSLEKPFRDILQKRISVHPTVDHPKVNAIKRTFDTAGRGEEDFFKTAAIKTGRSDVIYMRINSEIGHPYYSFTLSRRDRAIGVAEYNETIETLLYALAVAAPGFEPPADLPCVTIDYMNFRLLIFTAFSPVPAQWIAQDGVASNEHPLADKKPIELEDGLIIEPTVSLGMDSATLADSVRHTLRLWHAQIVAFQNKAIGIPRSDVTPYIMYAGPRFRVPDAIPLLLPVRTMSDEDLLEEHRLPGRRQDDPMSIAVAEEIKQRKLKVVD